MLFKKNDLGYVRRKVILTNVDPDGICSNAVHRALSVLNKFRCEINDIEVEVHNEKLNSQRLTITLCISCKNVDWADIEDELAELQYKTTEKIIEQDEKIFTKRW